MIGLLFGTEHESCWVIRDATDAVYECTASGEVIINNEQLDKKINLSTSIFDSHKLLGWYSFGEVSPPFHSRDVFFELN